MLFTNALIFQGQKGFIHGSLRFENGIITEIAAGDAREDGEDLAGAYIIPGLVDIHIHGCAGADFSDGSTEGFLQMGSYLAKRGITSFAPASMTLPYDDLRKAFRSAADYKEKRNGEQARLAGIHMEGPYLSEKKKGAQNREYLKSPDPEMFLKLQEESRGLIKIVDIAPELAGAETFIEEVSERCLVSLAHTETDYEQAMRAFRTGASHVTHLFNAMPPLHHRRPGLIGAAFDAGNVCVELVCDGVHIHPAVIRMAFRLFPGRICLVSDAARCCGMPDGWYDLGGQQVKLENGSVRLADGTIAGAGSDLFTDMINAIKFGIPAGEAITAATLIPAREAGIDAETGSLAPGKKADLVVCNREWKIEDVFIGGNRVLRG